MQFQGKSSFNLSPASMKPNQNLDLQGLHEQVNFLCWNLLNFCPAGISMLQMGEVVPFYSTIYSVDPVTHVESSSWCNWFQDTIWNITKKSTLCPSTLLTGQFRLKSIPLNIFIKGNIKLWLTVASDAVAFDQKIQIKGEARRYKGPSCLCCCIQFSFLLQQNRVFVGFTWPRISITAVSYWGKCMNIGVDKKRVRSDLLQYFKHEWDKQWKMLEKIREG